MMKHPFALAVFTVFAWAAATVPATAQANAAGVPCSQVIQKCQSCSGGSYVACAYCNKGWGVTSSGQCQECSSITANCTACSQGACTACPGGYQLQGGACVSCTAIDPQCTACSGTACTSCAGGYGLANGKCQACSSIDPKCTACANGVCTACTGGYGVGPGGTSCQQCTQIDPNCTSCATIPGACSRCGNGYAANLAGQCVKPGTPECSYSFNGQCCRCQYDCMSWNPASHSCIGPRMDGCGDCMSRQ